MPSASFHDFYFGDLQSVYALCVVPALLLVWLILAPAGRAAARSPDPAVRFIRRYCLFLGVETILDPIATGPLTRFLGASDTAVGTAILLAFVLLGDFRVYLLMFRLPHPERGLAVAIREAATWTLLVPITAYAVNRALHAAAGELPSQTLWLVYEVAFLGVALWMRLHAIAAWTQPGQEPLRRGLRAVAGYVAVYYALWALADVLILVLGLDAGWAVRVVPNQLYYSFFLPFVFFRLAARR